MRDAHRGIGRVHRLPARTRRAERVNPQILRLDFDVDFIGFGQYGDGGSRSVNAALLLGLRNALHAVHAALILQLGIDFVPLNRSNHFLHSAKRRRRAFQNFHLPALCFRVARIHAEKLPGKERGFDAAGSGADFDEHALLVVGIFRQQQELELALGSFLPRGERLFLFVRHLLHLGVFPFQEKLVRPGEVLDDLLVLAVFRDNFFQFGVLLGNFLEARGIADHFRRRELLCHLFVARIELVQFLSQSKYGHGKSSWKVEIIKSKIETGGCGAPQGSERRVS